MPNEKQNGDALPRIVDYYSQRVLTHGATPAGVDWNSAEGQRLRFQQLARLFVEEWKAAPSTIMDFGCGYGAFFDFLKAEYPECQFSERVGFDLSTEMLAQAKRLAPQIQWTSTPPSRNFDYIFASGVFNVKLDSTDGDWEAYVLETLDRIHALSQRGFAVNFLTSYSDVEKRAPHLYYADPGRLFDRAKRNYSRFVSVLHDYPLYEFTLVVRK